VVACYARGLARSPGEKAGLPMRCARGRLGGERAGRSGALNGGWVGSVHVNCELISCTTPACFSTLFNLYYVPTLVENS